VKVLEGTKIDIDTFRIKIDQIPFGNSAFQNTVLGDSSDTPERKARYVLLQLNQKLNALVECHFRRRLTEIDLAELREQRKGLKGFSADRVDVLIEQKEWGLVSEQKLIKDCLVEVESFQRMLEELPQISRAEFEAAEKGYWRDRLLGDAEREIISGGFVSVSTLAALGQLKILAAREGDGWNFLDDGGVALKLK